MIIPITRIFYVQRTPLTLSSPCTLTISGPADYLLAPYDPPAPPFGDFTALADAFPFHNGALALEAAESLQTVNYYYALRGECSHYAYTVYRTITRARWPTIPLATEICA